MCASLFTAEMFSYDLVNMRRHYNQEMLSEGSTLHAPLEASGGRCWKVQVPLPVPALGSMQSLCD